MKENLSAEDIAAALDRICVDLPAAAEQLRELDAAIGDGDLGITMTIGFGAVRAALPELRGQGIDTILLKSGMTFNRQAASTFGALFATMMMRAAKVARGCTSIGLADVAAMCRAAVEGVQERGKAQVGDKTLLDALVPACDTLDRAAAERASLSAGLAQAVAAAEEGTRATTAMKSRVGRAGWFSERTQGVQDPGATAIWLILRSFSAFVEES
ncbi:MAG: dihydroxyacetone kinase subunit DhaL [Anaerolineae bacterium]